MAFRDVTASDVLATLAEFDLLGRQEFLSRYGYGQASRYFVVREGCRYDSKAVVGVAHRVSNGRVLAAEEFSGGEHTAVRHLRWLGFTIQADRNPAWTRDEVTLACELVVRNDWRRLEAHDPRVIELSGILRQLDIYPLELRSPNFRNPNGVAKKTVDIATRLPGYTGVATNGGRHESSVLQEFLEDPVRMAAVAHAIRESVSEQVLELPAVAVADVDLGNHSAQEGGVLERRHLTRERDPRLRIRKIESVRARGGRVACEACGFDFASVYGERGSDYIECHHRIPLHVSGFTTTRLGDLVLLCSNCHRVIHRTAPWLTFEQLCALITAGREASQLGGNGHVP